ncbi:MAG TPA: hypothetical protein VN283_04810 [Thiobacillus sp.]|nr:hypothetical protein [Thiobacillus sp.]
MKFILAMFCFVPAIAGAYDTQRAQANLASDYATCAAFYMISTQVLTKYSQDASKAEAAARNALDMAVTLSNREVTSARVEMVTQMMLVDEMKSDWSNWAIVVNKHFPTCKEITENPVRRLEYWLNKR